MSTNAERDALVNRLLPEMTLSDGSPSSLTAPPPAMPAGLDAEGRSKLRFSVQGNAIITGGAGVLALENARALLEHGLTGLALFDISPEQSSDAIAALRRDFPGSVIATFAVDVTSAESIKTAVKAAVDQFGAIDILACFAGVVGCAHAVDLTAAGWRRTLDVNATGAFLCAQAVAKQMIAQGTGGAIVFIASMSGHIVNFPQPQAAYNVSKAAVIHLTRSLAAEWAQHGIRVNSVSPGYMDTILNEGPGLERVRKVWDQRNPMGRMGQPSELTGPIVLLCSRAGTYINGADLIVDGKSQVYYAVCERRANTVSRWRNSILMEVHFDFQTAWSPISAGILISWDRYNIKHFTTCLLS
jgi:sorbose reductase